MITSTCYDEALERIHRTGPEYEGWLSNHAPMVVEALERAGRDDAVHPWLETYLPRLQEAPTSRFPFSGEEWRSTLGDASRLGDWVAWFERELAEASWQDVLATWWWPRLLPGLAGGASHGVIRTGHAVRALRAAETEPRRAELGQALAYWAARWRPVPVVTPIGTASAEDLLPQLSPIPDQRYGVRARLQQLPDTPGFAQTVASLARPAEPADVPAALAAMVDGVVATYPAIAPGNPTMLVHAATGPNGVLSALPSLPQEQWPASFDAAWTLAAAVVAMYRPVQFADVRPPVDVDADEAFDGAVVHGGDHVIKLADTARDSAARGGGQAAVAAVETAMRLGA